MFKKREKKAKIAHFAETDSNSEKEESNFEQNDTGDIVKRPLDKEFLNKKRTANFSVYKIYNLDETK